MPEVSNKTVVTKEKTKVKEESKVVEDNDDLDAMLRSLQK